MGFKSANNIINFVHNSELTTAVYVEMNKTHFLVSELTIWKVIQGKYMDRKLHEKCKVLRFWS